MIVRRMRCIVEENDEKGIYKIVQLFRFNEIRGCIAGLRISKIILPIIRFWSDRAIITEPKGLFTPILCVKTVL